MKRAARHAIRAGSIVLTGAILGSASHATPPEPEPALPTVDDAAVALRDAAVDTFGGADALAAFAGMRAHGEALLLLDGTRAALRLRFSPDGGMWLERRTPERKHVSILSGPVAWGGVGRNQEALDARETRRLRLLYHHLAAAWDLAGAEPTALHRDGTSPEGWEVLTLDLPGGLHMRYFIDPGPGRLRRMEGTAPGVDTVTRSFGDFREVGSLVLPCRITEFHGERAVREMRFTRTAEVESFPPGAFLPKGTDASGS
ncbi:MAG: hypothetical protein QF819_09815 [Gemmatimonadota bacterium]|jgi:hypothetical protein|nr:hypothetical protein [Gemmatimonadota bacterium]MDP6529217.1 hypothetical protein [Gemmatimonadota bacterium]MDP6803448.1 hypothetical protein [Gemmatimonadota bacterium]MDP7031453.1 hypothetical protein [Gemmatimonadota bacterium]